MLTAKLCKACEDGDIKEVEELLASGATPNFAPSGSGHRYPLHYAATSGHVEIVKLLLQHEATVDPLEASNGWTPLMIATLKSANSQKHVDVMMILLEGGADAEAIDARGNTVLHILASLGQTKLLKRLLQKIPSLDVLGPGFGYLTPLHYAAEAGHVDTVEFLLQLRADPRGVDASGWTPVHWACRRGYKPVLDLLLSYGGSIEDRDFRSLTPLDVACLFNHTALAKLLDAQMLPGGQRDFSIADAETASNKSSALGDVVPQEGSHVLVAAPVEQGCSASSSTASWRAEKYNTGWRGHNFGRLVLGAFILVISFCDYLSRVSMAAFFAAAARTLEAFKVFFISRRGLLLYLDCLTHASALWVNSTEGSAKTNRDICTPSALELPMNRTGHIKPVSEHRLRSFRDSPGVVYPSDSPSSPTFGQSPRIAGEERTGPEAVNIRSPSEAKNSNTGAMKDERVWTQYLKDPAGGDSALPFTRSTYYTSATHRGTVPQRLHPCPSLQCAIQLHRQHLEIYRDRECHMTHSRSRIQQCGNVGSPSSGADGTVSAKELEPDERRQVIPENVSWRFHGGSVGLFADSLRAHASAQNSASVSDVCDEPKEQYLPNGPEQESTKCPLADENSRVMCKSLQNDTENQWHHGILAFAYGGQEAHVGLHVVAEGLSVASSPERFFPKEAHNGWSDSVSLKTESVASLLAGVSPYRSVQHKLKQQQAPAVRTSPPTIPLSRSLPAPESPPDVSDDCIHGAEVLGSRSIARPTAALPSAGTNARAGWRGSKLLFTCAQPAHCFTSAESVEDQNRHTQQTPELRRGSRVLKKCNQMPVTSHTDDAEYDTVVIQRQLRIFNWFEQFVAFRHAEITAMSKSAAAKVNGTASATASRSSCGTPWEIIPPVSSLSSSVDQADSRIKWATFGTLFPYNESMEQADGVKRESAAATLEEERVPCLCTEDLFDLPIKEPITAHAPQHPCGKARHEQRDFDPYRIKMGSVYQDLPTSLHWSQFANPDTSGGDSSTRGDSGSDQLATPILHYRFKDMVELPHLRETFFSLWRREFETLLFYQEHYFGYNPLGVTGVLQEGGISDFSQGHTPRLTSTEFCPSTSRVCICDDADTILKHSSCDREVLRIVPRHASEAQAHCSLQFPASGGATVAGVHDGMARDQTHLCTGPQGPPTTYAVAISLGGTGPWRRRRLSKRRWVSGKNSLHGLLKPRGTALTHSNTVSDLVSAFGDMEEETGVGDGRVADNSGAKHVLVAEACRFLIALSLTLDLVLGILPLLGAIILFYLLPCRDPSYQKSADSTALSLPSVCTQSESAVLSVQLWGLVTAYHEFIHYLH
ncbi:uncharacterized protein EMH_0041020 [Eimeria mitis]|uniref:Uncharacterized protein n=1 Tax=Eimeria mitis TaxID=44415 RepID=U6KE44_9EIME|nr:uncharacterized protein EMH_0041020 [Eimeria mitis]CDJ36219.1 hypothetical protein, conserved [Eimeria mitis]